MVGFLIVDNEYYNFRHLGDDVGVAIRVDPTRYPECGNIQKSMQKNDTLGKLESKYPEEAAYLGTDESITLANTLSSMSSSAQSIIRVLVAYTPAAKNAEGGTNGINALIENAKDAANQSYANSGIFQELELAHKVEVVYTENHLTQTVSRDCPATIALSENLLRLQNTTDGYMDEVHGLRNAYAADVVVLIYDNAADCGQAYIGGASQSSAFCVVRQQQANGH